MQEKLLKTSVAKYVPPEWKGTNTSGWDPVGARIIVAPYEAETKTQGGIEIPPELVARHAAAAEAGILVAMGPDAFSEYNPKPKLGDHVYMERFAGQVMPGYDSKPDRLMEDKCVGAVLTKAAA